MIIAKENTNERITGFIVSRLVKINGFSYLFAGALFCAALIGALPVNSYAQENKQVTYRTVKIDGLDIFYREAGSPKNPTVLLLHGFPTSSRMYRNLMPLLAARYHVVAPDYPGFGLSSAPPVDKYEYTFENLTNLIDKFTQSLKIDRYSIYLQDYGGPIGFRLAIKHPERVQALIVQNGNAYDEGLREFWNPIKAYWKDRSDENAAPIKKIFTAEGTKWQYTNGVRNIENLDPDMWTTDQLLMDRPGNKDIQLQLFYSYGSNPPLYPQFQEFFRKYQPPTLVVWGKNDFIFPPEGAEPYKRDLKNIEFHLLDTGHFALEEDGDVIAAYMNKFLDKQVKR
jgi:pimeloyl-ACP methyl ester carboxylesterase